MYFNVPRNCFHHHTLRLAQAVWLQLFDKQYTLKQIAALTKISTRTIRRYVSKVLNKNTEYSKMWKWNRDEFIIPPWPSPTHPNYLSLSMQGFLSPSLFALEFLEGGYVYSHERKSTAFRKPSKRKFSESDNTQLFVIDLKMKWLKQNVDGSHLILSDTDLEQIFAKFN